MPHQEDIEKAEHPLNRIIAIEERDDAVVLAATDIRLRRRISEAFKRAFRGDLKLGQEEDGYSCVRTGGWMSQPSEAVGACRPSFRSSADRAFEWFASRLR